MTERNIPPNEEGYSKLTLNEFKEKILSKVSLERTYGSH